MKTFLKYIGFIIILIGLLCGGIVFYAFKVEPFRVVSDEYKLNEESPGTEPVKIVQVSDFHIKEDFTFKNMKKVVDKINEQKADIVIFTGDLYDNYAKYNDDVNIISQLSNIEADYAKIAIWGNRDYGGGAVRNYQAIMEQGGFQLLRNENSYVSTDSGRQILISGLDDSLLGSPYLDYGIEYVDYNILLSHEPDKIDQYLDWEYDIILGGHSHGGQVHIPFLPEINEIAVSQTTGSTKYSAGMYSTKAKVQKVFVNTGIGTTHISARLGVVPEISVFYIYL